MAWTRDRLNALLDEMHHARIGVLGDFCLDMYWHADMTRSSLSRETPHFPLPIIEEKISLGAAGNVACNIAALGPGKLILLGAYGIDWRGTLLKKELVNLGAEVCLVTCEGRKTNAYIKPMLHGFGDAVQEQARLDFENDQPLSEDAENELINMLLSVAGDMDVLCVCDQMMNGCVTPRVREAVMRFSREGLKVVVDSRDNIALYRDVIVKPNEIEAARALGVQMNCTEACEQLAGKTGRTAIVTAGEKGCYLSDGSKATHIPAWPSEPPFDICGAGDTFLASFAMALAVGADPCEAASIGSMASSITIRKLGMTGTATKEEILDLWSEEVE